MQKVDLNQVLELLINEDAAAAERLLHDWFVGKSKSIVEQMRQEDDAILEDERLQDIEDDQRAIETEEYFGEDDEEEDAEEASDDLESELGADDEAGAEFGDDMSVEDKVDDLEAKLADLQAEFAALMGDEAAGEFGGEEVAGDDFGADAEGDDELGLGDEEEVVVGESEELEEDEVSEDEEVVSEDEDFDDLNEGWELEPVADPNLAGNKEIGDDGATIDINDKSPLPEHKGEDRVGGAAVEIKSKNHKGYDREASPSVNAKPLLKNQVKNAKADLTGVSKEGDKSALLNKKDGFGSDSPKSPIGAGATDLRGSDFKRK